MYPPQGPPPGYYQPQPQYMPVPYSGDAIAGFVLGLVSCLIPFGGIITGILGLVFSGKAIRQFDRGDPRQGRGLAAWGGVLSFLALLGYVLLLVLILV